MYKTGFWILLLVVLVACRNGKKTDKEVQDKLAAELSDVLNVNASSGVFELTSVWVKQFNFKYPGVKINLNRSDSIPKGSAGTLLISDIVKPGYAAYTKQKIAADIIVFIFNNDNPNIQSLVYEGAKPDELKALLFNDKITTWAQFLESGKSKDVVDFYRTTDDNGATDALYKFFKVDGAEMKGVVCNDDNEVLKYVKGNTFGLGYCSANLAYTPNGKFKASGIYVLPLDLNSNGLVDDNEHLFDRKDILINAFQKGQYPPELARYVCVYSDGKPEGKAAKVFIEWLLNEGLNYLPEKSLIPVISKE